MFNLILADPPWRQARGGKKSVRAKSSGVEIGYPVMDVDDIAHILTQARDLAKPDHIFFLWTIDKYLRQSEQMVEGLGYKIHARMIWNKVTGIPAAFTVRYGHEYLLYLYHGKMTPVAKDERGKIHTVFTQQVSDHSRKPDLAYEIIERLYPAGEKLELFARKRRPGWQVWGNQVECDITLDGYVDF